MEEKIKREKNFIPTHKEEFMETWKKVDWGVYNELWNKPAKTVILVGGKGTIKSHTINNFLLFLMAMNENRNVAIVRKWKDNINDSVFNAIEKNIRILGNELDIESNLVIGKNDNSHWTRKKTDMEFIFNETKQKVVALGSNDFGKAAGYSLAIPEHFLDTIFIEEPLEISDKGKNLNNEQESGLKSYVDFAAFIKTLFRGFHNTGGVKKEGVKPRVIMALNPWNKTHWILKDIVDKLLPFDRYEMIKNHKQVYYDKDYDNGDGILIIRSSSYINPRLEENEKAEFERMKETDPNEFDTQILGKSKDFSKSAHGDVMEYIKRSDYD